MYPWEICWHGTTHTVWLMPCCMGFVIQYGFCHPIASLTLGERCKGFLPVKKSDKNDLKRHGHPTFIRLSKIRFHNHSSDGNVCPCNITIALLGKRLITHSPRNPPIEEIKNFFLVSHDVRGLPNDCSRGCRFLGPCYRHGVAFQVDNRICLPVSL